MGTIITDQAYGISLDALDDDALVEVLHAAKEARILALLTSSSWRLCCLARSRLPCELRLLDLEQAALLLGSRTAARAPFIGCTRLTMSYGLRTSSMAADIMDRASQWTALRHLIVETGTAVRGELPLVLPALPSLQQLHNLQLGVPSLNPSCAGYVAQLVQLTALQLTVYEVNMDPADLLALSRLTRLRRLTVDEAPAVEPAATAAAAAGGPFCLSSSLTYLRLAGADGYCRSRHVSPMAYWLTHLPGCPQLRHLELVYVWKQHSSAHPAHLMRMCAQHNQQLRVLKLDKYFNSVYYKEMEWGFRLRGMPAAAGSVAEGWHPDAALASFTGLQSLQALGPLFAADPGHLHISSQADWQQLAHLTALTQLGRVRIHCAPLEKASFCSGLVSLDSCIFPLRGSDLARLLLACPALKRVKGDFKTPRLPAAPPLAGPQLRPHPSLVNLELAIRDSDWSGNGAWLGYDQQSDKAAAEFGALGGVLCSVLELTLRCWPCGYSEHTPGRGLPDLSVYTRLEALCVSFVSYGPGMHVLTPPQEDFMSMLRPHSQLRSLCVEHAPCISALVAGELRSLLPHLTRLVFRGCGAMTRAELAQVKQQLRPGLELVVYRRRW